MAEDGRKTVEKEVGTGFGCSLFVFGILFDQFNNKYLRMRCFVHGSQFSKAVQLTSLSEQNTQDMVKCSAKSELCLDWLSEAVDTQFSVTSSGPEDMQPHIGLGLPKMQTMNYCSVSLGLEMWHQALDCVMTDRCTDARRCSCLLPSCLQQVPTYMASSWYCTYCTWM